MLYELVEQPEIGDAQPWYSVIVAVEHVPGELYARLVVLEAQMLAGGVVQATGCPRRLRTRARSSGHRWCRPRRRCR